MLDVFELQSELLETANGHLRRCRAVLENYQSSIFIQGKEAELYKWHGRPVLGLIDYLEASGRRMCIMSTSYKLPAESSGVEHVGLHLYCRP